MPIAESANRARKRASLAQRASSAAERAANAAALTRSCSARVRSCSAAAYPPASAAITAAPRPWSSRTRAGPSTASVCCRADGWVKWRSTSHRPMPAAASVASAWSPAGEAAVSSTSARSTRAACSVWRSSGTNPAACTAAAHAVASACASSPNFVPPLEPRTTRITGDLGRKRTAPGRPGPAFEWIQGDWRGRPPRRMSPVVVRRPGSSRRFHFAWAACRLDSCACTASATWAQVSPSARSRRMRSRS